MVIVIGGWFWDWFVSWLSLRRHRSLLLLLLLLGQYQLCLTPRNMAQTCFKERRSYGISNIVFCITSHDLIFLCLLSCLNFQAKELKMLIWLESYTLTKFQSLWSVFLARRTCHCLTRPNFLSLIMSLSLSLSKSWGNHSCLVTSQFLECGDLNDSMTRLLGLVAKHRGRFMDSVVLISGAECS